MNETIAQSANSAGELAVGALNVNWADGVANFLNGLLNQNIFSGTLVGALLPVISILLLYWKWSSFMSFFETFGKTVLLLVAVYLFVKGVGLI